MELTYSIPSKITSFEKAQNDTFSKLYTKTMPTFRIDHGRCPVVNTYTM